jgi:hypothetical protein
MQKTTFEYAPKLFVSTMMYKKKKKRGKTISVTDRESPYGFEMLMLPHFLDKQFTVGGNVVSIEPRLPFIPQENSWYSFLLQAHSTPGPLCDWKD